MKRGMASVVILFLAATAASAWQAPALAPSQPAAHKRAAKAHPRKTALEQKPEPLPAQVSPPVPATLMNSAPVAPQVTMQSGQLTIDAPNCSLSDVLGAVHKATGAAIEGPTPSERIAIHLGPGSPEQVLDSLLRGTPYDYVILGTQGRPGVLARVVLTPASAAGSSPTPAPEARRSMPEPSQDQEGMPDRAPSADEGEQQQQPPQQPSDTDQQQPGQQPATQQDPNQPKTPEQLFQELQQLQQRQQPPR